MEPSREQVDRVLTEVFAEIERMFIVDGRGVVIEEVDLEEEDK